MKYHKPLAVAAAIAFLTGILTPPCSAVPAHAEPTVFPRMTIDLNANDGRIASYAHNAANGIVKNETVDSFEIDGLTFTLSTETGGGTLYREFPSNWKAADLCEDERLDAIDLCIMKRNLLQS